MTSSLAYSIEPPRMSDPPTNIRALQAEQVLEVTWPESRVDPFPISCSAANAHAPPAATNGPANGCSTPSRFAPI